jgi:hypothetical protein
MLEREITTPEEIHKLSEAIRDHARDLHDGLEATLAEFEPMLVNGLIEKGHTKLEARRIAGKVLRGWHDSVAAFNSASIGGPSTWKQYQRLVAQPTKHRRTSGKVFHIPEKRAAS